MFKDYQDIQNFIHTLSKNKELYSWYIKVGKYKLCYWHLIHLYLASLINSLLVSNACDPEIKLSFWDKLKLLVNAIKYRPRANSGVDVLFYADHLCDIDRGDYIENVYYDFFAHEIDNFGMKVGMLHQPVMKPFNAKKRHFNTSSLNWIYIKIMMFSKLRSLKCSQTKDIDSFVIFLKKALTPYLLKNDLDKVASQFSTYIKRKLQCLPLEVYYWEKIFNRYRPKFFIAHCVAYGGAMGVISLLAKSKGIAVIENQHGNAGGAHIAYNYSCDKRYLRFLPDYLWGYGKKWLQSMNLPIKKIVMGNSYLQESKLQYKQAMKKYNILFITDSQNYALTNQIALKFTDKIDTILLRPHPRELAELHQRYGLLLEQDCITLDCDRDVMQSISSAGIILAITGNAISATVYEALALGAKVAIIADTRKTILGLELIQDYIKVFDYRDSELVDQVQALLHEKTVQYKTDDLYAPNWRQNIRDFFAGQLKVS